MTLSKILIGAALSAAISGAAHAQSASFETRHWDTSPGAVSVEADGKTFVNHGLVGVGRLSAATRDFKVMVGRKRARKSGLVSP